MNGDLNLGFGVRMGGSKVSECSAMADGMYSSHHHYASHNLPPIDILQTHTSPPIILDIPDMPVSPPFQNSLNPPLKTRLCFPSSALARTIQEPLSCRVPYCGIITPSPHCPIAPCTILSLPLCLPRPFSSIPHTYPSPGVREGI